MARNDAALREHLSRALSWESAHLTLEDAVKGLPPRLRGRRPKGLAHSPWELLEHVRLAQRDLLDYATRANYAKREWQRDYWPSAPKPPRPGSWAESLKEVAGDLAALQALVETAPDLLADVPSAKGKSLLRAVLLALDHTAYHVGQLVLTRKLLGA